jgi:hypothetical protein
LICLGDPNVPWEVRKAKQLQRKIEDKQDAILAVEEENRIRELYEQREGNILLDLEMWQPMRYVVLATQYTKSYDFK